jgi:hypothetical protein
MVRVGYNDPHVLGVALSLAGLWLVIRFSPSPACISLFCFRSAFYQQSLAAFPLAVAIQLLTSTALCRLAGASV